MAIQETLTSGIHIKRINELRGPNIWAHQPVLEAHVNIGPYEERPSDKIAGFTDRLFEAIPTLIEHRCSEGHRGGFLVRMREGTYMGHIMEHVCLELQCLAGMDVAYGKTRSEGDDFPGEYRIVVEYWDAGAGKRSIQAAAEGCEALARGEPYDFASAIAGISNLGKRGMFKPATRALLAVARRRGIPWMRLEGRNNLQLGYGKHSVKILDGKLPKAKKSEIRSIPSNEVKGQKSEIQKDQSTEYYNNILDRFFPEGSHGRIPIVAITGTNGGSNVTRMVGHIMQTAGHHTGIATTDGLYLDRELLLEGDRSGPRGAEEALVNPDVEAAVLEVAPGGIVEAGLAFDVCDVGVMLNVAPDHLNNVTLSEANGLDGVHSIEDLAYVHGVVIESVRRSGYGVLNADDPLVARMDRYCDGRIIYFSPDPESPRLVEHIDEGGMDVTVVDGWLVLRKGERVRRVVKVEDIQALKLDEALAATAAARGAGVRSKVIARALRDL